MTSVMEDEERRFMWNLAFFFTIKHGGATAFRSFTTIRSLFISQKINARIYRAYCHYLEKSCSPLDDKASELVA